MGGDPRNGLTMCGVLMFCAAAAVFRVREKNAEELPVGVIQHDI